MTMDAVRNETKRNIQGYKGLADEWTHCVTLGQKSDNKYKCTIPHCPVV